MLILQKKLIANSKITKIHKLKIPKSESSLLQKPQK